jgi:predicted nucleic acid-binding protein
MAPLILDTGPLVALLDKDDEFHGWVVDQFRKIETPLLTCDAVISETCFLMRSLPATLPRLDSFFLKGDLISLGGNALKFARIFELMQVYRNVPMSFADACLTSMVEMHSGAVIITLDRDFTIYRQQRRKLIPLLAPF